MVEEKAARRLPTKSGALRPVMEMTMVKAVLPTLDSSMVSHLGCPVRARPVLKVVSLLAIVLSVEEVGRPCTKS